jgi:hypothetical protein
VSKEDDQGVKERLAALDDWVLPITEREEDPLPQESKYKDWELKEFDRKRESTGRFDIAWVFIAIVKDSLWSCWISFDEAEQIQEAIDASASDICPWVATLKANIFPMPPNDTSIRGITVKSLVDGSHQSFIYDTITLAAVVQF